MEGYVEHYNNLRLNSAVGYITPKDMLAGRQAEIHVKRGSKVGGGAKTASDSSAAGCVKNEEASLGEAEAPDEGDYFRMTTRPESRVRCTLMKGEPGLPRTDWAF